MAGWHGFEDHEIGLDTSLREMGRLDEEEAGHSEKCAQEMVVADVVTLLDEFYECKILEPLPVERPFVLVSAWTQKWFKFAWNIIVKGGEANVFAEEVIGVLDSVAEEPLEYIEQHNYERRHTVLDFKGEFVERKEDLVVRKKKVISRGNRSKFAASLAKLAYNKFGSRALTEANYLVTRKWLQKCLEEPVYKDLRTSDKNVAIDRATFLSFVPTQEFRKMKIAVTTRAWEQRVGTAGVFGGVFGRIFGLASGPPEDL
jgi:hypothetical protein